MVTMNISEFKAKCINTLKTVQASGQGVIVTLRGRPIAVVNPVAADRPKRRLWALEGQMQINGDIIRADFSDEWELNR